MKCFCTLYYCFYNTSLYANCHIPIHFGSLLHMLLKVTKTNKTIFSNSQIFIIKRWKATEISKYYHNSTREKNLKMYHSALPILFLKQSLIVLRRLATAKKLIFMHFKLYFPIAKTFVMCAKKPNRPKNRGSKSWSSSKDLIQAYRRFL